MLPLDLHPQRQHHSTHEEVFYILLTDTGKLMNRDDGVTISDYWTALLSHTMTSASA